jgi:hypothetical protein
MHVLSIVYSMDRLSLALQHLQAGHGVGLVFSYTQGLGFRVYGLEFGFRV